MANPFFQTITILPTQLPSTKLRQVATGGQILGSLLPIPNPVNNGIRKIDVDQVDTVTASNPVTGAVQNFVGKVVNTLKKFFGFAWPAIVRILPRSFSELWSTIVTVGFTLWTFDWNQTDNALREQIKQNNNQILSAAAGALGTYLGWGAVRLVQMGVSKLIKTDGRDRSLDIRVPIVSPRVASALAEEGNDEVRGQMIALLTQIKQAQVKNAFLGFMLTARQMELFGLKPQTDSQKAGEKQRTSDSFAQRWEKWKETSVPQWLQQPLENFAENLVEAVIEAGYILGAEADAAYMLAKSAVRDARGPEKTIVVQPDKRLERDKYIVTGPQEFVQEEVQRIQHQHQMLDKKDVGIIIGERLEDSLQKKPMVRQLKIRWNTVKEPPLVHQDGQVGKFSEVNIPKVRVGLSWREVKVAADEFLRGNPYWQITYKCWERDSYIGDLVVSGNNEEECERRAKKLKLLMPSGVDLRGGTPLKRSPNSAQFRYAAKQFFPHDCTLTVVKNSLDDAERRDRRGKYRMDNPEDRVFDTVIKVRLYGEQEPDGFTGFR